MTVFVDRWLCRPVLLAWWGDVLFHQLQVAPEEVLLACPYCTYQISGTWYSRPILLYETLPVGQDEEQTLTGAQHAINGPCRLSKFPSLGSLCFNFQYVALSDRFSATGMLSAPLALHPRTAAASLVYSPEGSSLDAVVLEDGRQLHTNAVVSAAGAWMRELMPVPMLPHKGQMMSLRQPEGRHDEG